MKFTSGHQQQTGLLHCSALSKLRDFGFVVGDPMRSSKLECHDEKYYFIKKSIEASEHQQWKIAHPCLRGRFGRQA
jgi:hypothetical protein